METKRMKITLGVLTRVEYTEVVEVPKDFNDDDLKKLIDERYDTIDESQFVEDEYFWEKGESSAEEAPPYSGEPTLLVTRPEHDEDYFTCTKLDN